MPLQSDSADPQNHQVTQLLLRVQEGDQSAAEDLLPLVYGQLKGIARAMFSRQSPGHTLQPTAVVHEAWMKLAGSLDQLTDRRHFLIIAGKAMRQVIADHARGRMREKRGGNYQRVTFDGSLLGSKQGGGMDLFELHDSLTKLASLNQRHARVAELRLFSGLTLVETSETVGVSLRSVEADWAMAKAWLRTDLAQSG